MTADIDIALIQGGLAEFSSEEEQRRLWLSDGQNGADVGSFTEAYCYLFDDSRLGLGLDGGGSVFDPATDDAFRRLDGLLASVDDKRDPSEVIADKKMIGVRMLAASLLQRIENRPSFNVDMGGLRTLPMRQRSDER